VAGHRERGGRVAAVTGNVVVTDRRLVVAEPAELPVYIKCVGRDQVDQGRRG